MHFTQNPPFSVTLGTIVSFSALLLKIFVNLSPDFSPVGSVGASAAQRSPPETSAPENAVYHFQSFTDSGLTENSCKQKHLPSWRKVSEISGFCFDLLFGAVKQALYVILVPHEHQNSYQKGDDSREYHKRQSRCRQRRK